MKIGHTKDMPNNQQGLRTCVAKRLWRGCRENVERMWRECGEVVERMWGRCGDDVERLWGGESVERLWGECGENVERLGVQPCEVKHKD